MEEFVNRSPRSLIEKIRDFFLNFVDEIRAIAERYANRAGSERQEIKALLGMSDELTDIARFFDAALETASMETEAEVGETVFARGDVGKIQEEDIAALRTVGRKSINAFNSKEIQNAEKWARKFFAELGIKSPFFRKWFGEWRAVDNGTYVEVAEIPEYVATNDARKKNRGNVVNEDTGWDIRISREGETNTISHSGFDRRSEYGLAGIQALIRNALLLDSEVHIPHSSSAKNDTVTFDHKLYALGKDERGQVALYKITVEEFFQSAKQPGEKKFHNLRYIEKIADNIGGRTYENSRSGGSTSDVSTTGFSVAQLYAFVKRYDKDFTPAPKSSTVIENGRPRVVYHQTAGDFSVFNTNNPVAGLNDSETPNGMFFKTNDHDIGIGGDKQMAVYLKMENPLHFANRKEANAWYRDHVDGYAELAEEYDAAAEKFNADVDRVSDEIFATDDEDRIQELEAEEDRLIEDFKPVENEYRGRLRKLLDDYFLSGKSGYDGIELDYDGHRWVNGVRENVHTFIVFEPTQIKSATDNVGTFDSENPDIRFSLNVTPAQTRRIESNQPVSGDVEAKWSLARNEEFMDNARNINAKTGNVDQAQLNNFAEMS